MREGRRAAAAVGMEESNIPRNAARGGCEHKMQNRMGQLLKDIQCILNLHFADGDPDGVAAGDGLIPLLALLVFASTQSAEDDSPPCDPRLLARTMADSCVGYLGQPPEECCVMVVAAVGHGYADPVPCLCKVVRDPDFPASLNVYTILKLYQSATACVPWGLSSRPSAAADKVGGSLTPRYIFSSV
jgi:hypothetical protein